MHVVCLGRMGLGISLVSRAVLGTIALTIAMFAIFAVGASVELDHDEPLASSLADGLVEVEAGLDDLGGHATEPCAGMLEEPGRAWTFGRSEPQVWRRAD